jgi:hypothetical protein
MRNLSHRRPRRIAGEVANVIMQPIQATVAPLPTPSTFLEEVGVFRRMLADPRQSSAQRAHAYCEIVRHAGMLDPHDTGFESAGVALKEALCLWLDSHSRDRATGRTR